MTVTTIPGVGLEVKRALDNQNKTAGNAASATTAPAGGTASLPSDTVSLSAAPSVPLNLAQAQQATIAENQTAASSTLSNDDIDALNAGTSPQQQVLAQAKASIAAQTNRLPPSMLQLLVE